MTGRSFARSLVRLLFAGLALVPAAAGAQVPEAPTRWVTDSAGFLSESARRELDGQLENYERQTGHQALVWIARTTGGVPIEDFAVRAFAAWKVGRKGLDDGVALFVFTDDRKLRIEVGYGLEGQLPDAIASRIIREDIVPRIQAGDPDGAIRGGVSALIGAIEGEGSAAPSAFAPSGGSSPNRAARPTSVANKILVGLALLAFLILFITNPALAVHLLLSVLSSGRGGGHYSSRGGGGFSGGGGRSGGGGASGSW